MNHFVDFNDVMEKWRWKSQCNAFIDTVDMTKICFWIHFHNYFVQGNFWNIKEDRVIYQKDSSFPIFFNFWWICVILPKHLLCQAPMVKCFCLHLEVARESCSAKLLFCKHVAPGKNELFYKFPALRFLKKEAVLQLQS